MVAKTPMSWLFYILHVVHILPSGKSTLQDKIGLTFWTLFALCVCSTFIYICIDYISAQTSVLTLFMVGANVFAPCVQLISTFPALYRLKSCYPHVQENLLPPPKHPWIFLVDVIFCNIAIFASTMQIHIRSGNDHLIGLVCFQVVNYGMMTLSSLITVVCLAQITKRLEKDGQFLGSKIMSEEIASEILTEFLALKDGLSPLLFFNFSTKCVCLISFSTNLLICPNWFVGLLTTCLVYDLVYITITIDQTYQSFKEMSLELRYN